MKRCHWCNLKNQSYIKYHDEEWGKLNLEENYLFEMLLLESFQAGLSWECILNKREAFRKAFSNFDPKEISKYTEDDFDRLSKNKDIVRNKLKIKAASTNAKIFLSIEEEFNSFKNYLYSFWNKQIIFENDKTTNSLSDEISNDLRKRGMKFVGSTIIYSFLQAIGIINSHEKDCFLYSSDEKFTDLDK